MNQPNFYFRFLESDTLDEVRACFVVKKIKNTTQGCYWRVKVDPALPGALCGTKEEVSEVILIERHPKENLLRLNGTAVLVSVCTPLNQEALTGWLLRDEDLQYVGSAHVVRDPLFLNTENYKGEKNEIDFKKIG